MPDREIQGKPGEKGPQGLPGTAFSERRWLRVYFVVTVVVGALLFGWGFQKIEAQQTKLENNAKTIGSLVVYNQKGAERQRKNVDEGNVSRYKSLELVCAGDRLTAESSTFKHSPFAPEFRALYKKCNEEVVTAKLIAKRN